MKRTWVLLLLVLVLITVPQISATDSPSPRMGSRMIYDPVDQRVLLFGGSMYDNGYTLYNDIWSYRYETNTWTEIETSGGPSGRFNTPLIYDSDTHRIIVFSGFGANERSADMYSYDIAENTWTRLQPSPMPFARSDTSVVYDEKYDKIIMFSGYVHHNDTHPLDTWAYDVSTNTWEKMSPNITPKGQYGHYFIYDSIQERSLMLGGHWSEGQRHGYTDGLWQYDYGSDIWTLLEETPSLPNRYWHTFSYNTGNGEATVFSGSHGSSDHSDDTWILDTGTGAWRQVESDTRPPSRVCSTAVFDPVNDVTLIFGGMVDQVYLDDLWVLDSSGQWRELTGGTDPTEPIEENEIPGFPMLSIMLGIVLIAQVGLGKRLVNHS
jgi:hypothetical protein